MPEKPQRDAQRPGPLRTYLIGLGLGSVCTLYGLYALMSRTSYLPGVKSVHSTVTGLHGIGLALAYLLAGVYLLVRHLIHPRVRREWTRGQLYILENALLVGLIAALVYVLLNVGTAG